VSEPLVSLVMPVWRPRPDWLLQAVRSALAQRDCELELIVVDDGNAEPLDALLAEVRDPRPAMPESRKRAGA
jgi:glycosyltransferase involved in cell wall biosynthesis